jgi:hypothetical protein
MVHALCLRYAHIIRFVAFDAADPATVIAVIINMVLPPKSQYVLTLLYPNVLA